MTRPGLPAAALLTALAAWLSLSTLAVGADGARIGLLPLSPTALVFSLGAAVAVAALARAGASLIPFALLVLLLLPWAPLPLPAPLLLWTGEVRWLIWMAVAVISVATVAWRFPVERLPARVLAVARQHPSFVAGALAFVIFAVSARAVAPSIPGGDEPHYLVITQSLLLDHDIKIENNHRRGDYQAYYSGSLAPHFIRRGLNGEIYSIHAPGLSALVAPAFALAGYGGVVVMLLLIAASGSALAWHLAWRASGRRDAAWFGWAAVTLSATTIFHSFTVYPDGVGSVLALTGVWALIRAEEERRTGDDRQWPWFLHGAALALLPWLHSRYALLAGCLGALVILRLSATKSPAGKAMAFLSVPALGALAWMTFFLVIYGVADPSAPYGNVNEFSLGFIPGGLAGLLFDQRFGLIANAPVLLVGLAGLAMMLRIARVSAASTGATGLADRRLAIELIFIIVPYLLTATSYAMWWAGWSAPARFANPAVPVFAIPCAVAWSRIRNRGSKAVAAGALALTAFVSAVLVFTDGGRLAYNTREAPALWLEWASTLASLADGVPIWYRGREGQFTLDIAIWATALVSAWLVARALADIRGLRSRGSFATAVVALFLCSTMIAVAFVWRVHGTSAPRTAAAELGLLREVARTPRALALSVSPPRLIAPEALLPLLTLEPAVVRGNAGRGRLDPTVAALPAVPAGRYRVRLEGGGPGGWLMIGIGQDQFALRSEALSWPAAPFELDFPVDVRALVVRGDEDARRGIRRVLVEPLALIGSRDRLTDLRARRAVKYDGASVFFLDDRSFAEPEGFWLGGGRQSSFVVQSDDARASIPFRLRNAPVENRLTLESGQWREELTLAAGEERQIEVPLAPGQRAALVTSTTTAGFRPSESTPGSRDDRFLGVWVRR
jgi:hypothetical protein